MQCRACMKTKGCVLFDMAMVGAMDNKNLYDYFNECTQLHATSDDNYPKTLCKLCVGKLQEAYKFKKCARESDERFKELLSLKRNTKEMCGSNKDLYDFSEDMEHNTDDPLNMETKADEKALREPGLDLAPGSYCLEGDSEIPEKDIKLEDFVHDEDDLSNDKPSQSAMAIDSDKEEYESVGYFCEICGSRFAVKSELTKHVAKEHKSDIICVTCPKVFDMPNELNIHKKLVHGTECPVQCDFCTEKPKIPRSELRKHFQNNHSSRYLKYFPLLRKRREELGGILNPYNCKYCIQKFTDAFELADHIKKHVFKCPFCAKNFTKMHTYYAHARRLHNCSGRRFLPIPYVVEDVNTKGDKPFECKACNKSYRNLGSYNTHIRQMHESRNNEEESEAESPNEYIEGGEENGITETENIEELYLSADNNIEVNHCIEEGKEKDILSETGILEKSKSKKKNAYLCSFCPRILSSKSILEKHERVTHLKSNIDFSECPICEKRVRTESLSHHMNYVHCERKYRCDICGNKYKSKSRLVQHKKLHNREQHFPCNLCNKTFPAKYELNVHMRVHTGELPYACHICDRRFRIKVRLTYHLQHHNNVKHKCKECGKEYNNVTSLRIHSYEHTGIYPYNCPVCDFKSVKREVFTKHLLRKHDLTMTVDELFAMFKANTGRCPRVRLDEELETLNEASEEYSY